MESMSNKQQTSLLACQLKTTLLSPFQAVSLGTTVIVSDQLLMQSALIAALDSKTEGQNLASSSETDALNLLKSNAPTTLICTPSLKKGCSINLARSAKEVDNISVILIISSKSDLGFCSRMHDYCDVMLAEWDLDHGDKPLIRALEAISTKKETYHSPSIAGHLSYIQKHVAILTPREKSVLSLILNGSSNQDIADRLTISPSTAKSYSRDVLRKLGTRNRHEAVVKGIKLGLLGDQP